MDVCGVGWGGLGWVGGWVMMMNDPFVLSYTPVFVFLWCGKAAARKACRCSYTPERGVRAVCFCPCFAPFLPPPPLLTELAGGVRSVLGTTVVLMFAVIVRLCPSCAGLRPVACWWKCSACLCKCSVNCAAPCPSSQSFKSTVVLFFTQTKLPTPTQDD